MLCEYRHLIVDAHIMVIMCVKNFNEQNTKWSVKLLAWQIYYTQSSWCILLSTKSFENCLFKFQCSRIRRLMTDITEAQAFSLLLFILSRWWAKFNNVQNKLKFYVCLNSFSSYTRSIIMIRREISLKRLNFNLVRGPSFNSYYMCEKI